MTTLKLLGKLGQRYGRLHNNVHLDHAADALRYLAANYPDFLTYCNELAENNITLKIITSLDFPEGVDEGQLFDKLPGDLVIVAPVPAAQGGGLLKSLLGVALIGAAFFTGGISLAGLSISATTLGLTGLALVGSGISQMMAKTAKKDDDKEKKSFIFGNAADVGPQGNPVPIIYGERIVDLIPISSGIVTEDLSKDIDDSRQIDKTLFAPMPYLARLQPGVPYQIRYNRKGTRLMDVSYIQNNDPNTGLVVTKDANLGNAVVVYCYLNVTLSSAIKEAEYPLQRVQFYGGSTEYAEGPNRLEVFGHKNNLNYGLTSIDIATSNQRWVTLDLSKLPQCNVPYPVYALRFSHTTSTNDYLCIGELRLFGPAGVTESDLVSMKE